MRLLKAGEEVDYTITYLEMTERPGFDRPQLIRNEPSALIRAQNPPRWYFLSLYDAVGADYEWVDWHNRPVATLDAYLANPDIQLFTLLSNGWPNGFFMLERKENTICDLAYFGLVPEAIGKGLGTWLLKTAIFAAWDLPDVEKLTLNTCTLDHPRALAHYQKHGFVPVGQETKTRVLTKNWDPSRFP